MRLFAKPELLAHIHGGYLRTGSPHKRRILDESCATCIHHRKANTTRLPRPPCYPRN
jgi:hypothetical protein